MRRSSLRRRFASNRAALAGLIVLSAVLAATMIASFAPGRDGGIDLDRSLEPPSLRHPFGTDAFGRDLAAEVFRGGRVSLSVGVMARTISLLLGLLLGTIAGYAGGKTDSLIMRLADITFAFPTLLLLIAIMAVASPGLT
ncbi:MAG TPA: hypothetical protein VLA34_09920, partial [Candidatus Krumholzibacterium sp.]|nr:hypothetical protein [Candidatus Krumholzibacterium sp.]